MIYTFHRKPVKIIHYVSVYNPTKQGSLKLFNYEPEKGEPRPGWTYRSSRRNRKYGRAQYKPETRI